MKSSQDIAVQLEQITEIAARGLDAATDTIPAAMRLLAAVQALRKVGQLSDTLAQDLGAIPVRSVNEWEGRNE
jgi:hypothetical protein